MRQLKISQHPHPYTPEGTREPSEQLESLLLHWTALGTTGLSPEAEVLQPLLDDNARFVVALAKQCLNQAVSQEALVTAAHRALVTVLNQYAHRPDKLYKGLTLALRNAMIATVQAPAGGPR